MSDLRQQPWWKRKVTLTPAVATLVGIALGSAVGVLAAFPWSDRVSFTLFTVSAFQGCVWGYTIWLVNDKARSERFQRITGLVTLVLVAGPVLAFPDFWRQMWLVNPLLSVCFVGGLCAISILGVGAGWGLIHLFTHLSALLRGGSKASSTFSTGGVWDRDLDQTHAVVKRLG